MGRKSVDWTLKPGDVAIPKIEKREIVSLQPLKPNP